MKLKTTFSYPLRDSICVSNSIKCFCNDGTKVPIEHFSLPICYNVLDGSYEICNNSGNAVIWGYKGTSIHFKYTSNNRIPLNQPEYWESNLQYSTLSVIKWRYLIVTAIFHLHSVFTNQIWVRTSAQSNTSTPIRSSTENYTTTVCLIIIFALHSTHPRAVFPPKVA